MINLNTVKEGDIFVAPDGAQIIIWGFNLHIARIVFDDHVKTESVEDEETKEKVMKAVSYIDAVDIPWKALSALTGSWEYVCTIDTKSK